MKSFRSTWMAGVILILVSLACGSVAQPTPTTVPTGTNTPIPPTSTLTPTATFYPTVTPNATATKEMEETNSRIQNYFEKGYIATKDGRIHSLVDFSQDYAQINYFSNFTSTGFEDTVKDFVFRADLHWENAIQNPETSGCGIAFRINDNGAFYSAYLDTERVVIGGFNPAKSNYIQRFGVTSGNGRVNFGNPADANFTLILNGPMAYVLVDDSFVGSYTLHNDSMLDPGYTGYFIKSGTNKDFGTRCKITNATLWIPNS